MQDATVNKLDGGMINSLEGVPHWKKWLMIFIAGVMIGFAVTIAYLSKAWASLYLLGAFVTGTLWMLIFDKGPKT